MKIILITAVWCPSCLIMKPRYYDFFQKKVIEEIIEYDFDMDEDKINDLKIGVTLPVCIAMEKDREVLRIIGEKKVKEIENIFKDLEDE